MRIYVATKYEEKVRAKEVAQQLEAVGHTITYAWWNNEQVSSAQAVADAAGVETADALVLIVEKDLPYAGALVEFGIAVGRGIPIYILGSAIDERCIFMKLPNLHRNGLASLLNSR